MAHGVSSTRGLQPNRRVTDRRQHSTNGFSYPLVGKSLASEIPLFFKADATGSICWASAALLDAVDASGSTVAKVNWLSLVDERDIAAASNAWMHSFAEQTPFSMDLRLRDKDGATCWHRVLATTLEDGDHPGMWIGVCVDIDDLRREQRAAREKEALLRSGMLDQRLSDLTWHDFQTDLAHAARLSTASQMAATLAHELSQPLTAASTFAAIASRVLARSTDETLLVASQAAANAAEQVLRAGEIIRDLRDLVSTGESQRRCETLRLVVEEAAGFALIGIKDVQVVVRITLGDQAQVLISRIQIQQVLVNLMRNAVEAMEEVERRELELRLDEGPNGFALVTVTDSGHGLSDALAARLFKPCTSTKVGGMGIGLSICRTIIEAHGGRIWVERSLPEGAVFKFTLPIADDDDCDDR